MEAVKIPVSVSRCPFCHEAVEFERVRWVACAGCLARSHASCWAELGACATCGDPRQLVEPPERKRRWISARAIAGPVFVLATQGAMVAWMSLSMKSSANELQNVRETLQKIDRPRRDPPTDRTDEVLSKIDDASSEEWKRDTRIERRLQKLEDTVASAAAARTVTVVATTPEKPSKASALEALKAARDEGTLRSSELDRARDAVLAGKLAPENAVEVLRLGRLSREGMIRSSELDRAKNDLLQAR